MDNAKKKISVTLTTAITVTLKENVNTVKRENLHNLFKEFPFVHQRLKT